MEGGDGGLGLPNQALMAAYALHQDQQDDGDRRSSTGSLCSAGSVGYWTATSGGGSSAAGSIFGGSARFSSASLDAALRRGGLGSAAGMCSCPQPRRPCTVLFALRRAAASSVTPMPTWLLHILRMPCLNHSYSSHAGSPTISPHGSSSPPLSPTKRSNLGPQAAPAAASPSLPPAAPPPATAPAAAAAAGAVPAGAAQAAAAPPEADQPTGVPVPLEWQQLCAQAHRPPSHSLTLREQYNLQQAAQHQQYQVSAAAPEGSPDPVAAAQQPLLSSPGAADTLPRAASSGAAPLPPLPLQASMPGSAAPSAHPSHRGSSMMGGGWGARVSWMHYPSAQQELSGWPGSPVRTVRRTSVAAYGFGYQRDPSAAAELAAAGAAAAAAAQQQLSAAEQQRRAAVAEAEARQAEEALAEVRSSLRHSLRQHLGDEAEGLIGVPEAAAAEAAAVVADEGGGGKSNGPSRTTTEDSDEVGDCAWAWGEVGWVWPFVRYRRCLVLAGQCAHA